MTRRLARLLLVAGTVAVVMGLAKPHAAQHGDDLRESSRSGWSGDPLAWLGCSNRRNVRRLFAA